MAKAERDDKSSQIRALADQIRDLALKMRGHELKSVPRNDYVAMVGYLLLDAIDAGAFASMDCRALRHYLGPLTARARDTHGDSPHAWARGVVTAVMSWLRDHGQIPKNAEEEDVSALADVLDAEVDRLACRADANEFTDRQREVLQVLWEHKAFSCDERTDTKRIVDAAGGGKQGSYKDVIAKLKRRGFVATSRGRGGGVWLTASGRNACAGLFPGKG